jgi:hypothetical protein
MNCIAIPHARSDDDNSTLAFLTTVSPPIVMTRSRFSRHGSSLITHRSSLATIEQRSSSIANTAA